MMHVTALCAWFAVIRVGLVCMFGHNGHDCLLKIINAMAAVMTSNICTCFCTGEILSTTYCAAVYHPLYHVVLRVQTSFMGV
jgi:hypothetical protein